VRCATRGDRSGALALRSSSRALRSVRRAVRSTTLGDRSGMRAVHFETPPVDSGTRAPHGATRRQRKGMHAERNRTRPAGCGTGRPFFPSEPDRSAARLVLVEEGRQRDGIETPLSLKDLLFIDNEQVRFGTAQVLGVTQSVRSPEKVLFVDERRLPAERSASVPERRSRAPERRASTREWRGPRSRKGLPRNAVGTRPWAILQVRTVLLASLQFARGRRRAAPRFPRGMARLR
jgi:hypothetical protein